MYRILVCNDDGIGAEGLQVLAKNLGLLADVYVVAPSEEKSAMGHAVTFKSDITVKEAKVPGAKKAYAVDGTPVDCVKIGLQLLEENGIRPDYVVSGINLGINTGSSAIYSGTVEAAREGAINGIRSIALSVEGPETENYDYICSMLRDLLELAKNVDPSIVLSVNAPDLPVWEVKGVKMTSCAEYGHGENFLFEKTDDEGHYRIGKVSADCDSKADNDWNAVKQGYVAVTPLNAYNNDVLALKSLQGLSTEQTVAVFVDFQEKLVPAMRKKEELIANNVKLAKCLKRLDVPMVATTQYSKGLGNTVSELDKAMGKHDTVEKETFSCFGERKFAEKFIGVKHGKIILAGIEAHICLQQTALDFLARGFQVYVVKDCCQSRNKEDFKTAMELLAAKGCTVTTWESVVYELMGSSRHPGFKTISKIVKEG